MNKNQIGRIVLRRVTCRPLLPAGRSVLFGDEAMKKEQKATANRKPKYTMIRVEFDTPEEAEAIRQAAKRAGYRSVGKWFCQVLFPAYKARHAATA